MLEHELRAKLRRQFAPDAVAMDLAAVEHDDLTPLQIEIAAPDAVAAIFRPDFNGRERKRLVAQ